MATFKQMIKDGTIKRADAMKVQFADLHVEPGFNLRVEDEEFQAGIEVLADYIFDGGIVPPLEVRPREEGGVYIVDGHRRHRAYGLAIERGAPIEWIEVRAFVGNDADRVARIITSAEGKPLTPLETSRGYKRLAAFGWTPEQIAKKVGRSRAHVEQLLLLANANTDVQRAVADGQVSAALAVQTVRQHGEKAGEVIAGQLEVAKAAGKKKVTAAIAKPKPVPRETVDNIIDAIDFLVGSAPEATHGTMTAIRDGHGSREALVAVDAGALFELIEVYRAALDHRAAEARRQREAANANAQTAIHEAA